MELVLASNNHHKLLEFNHLLKGVTITLPKDYGINFECEETENSYLGNALLKAKTLYQQLKKPVLADDSGIEVLSLNKAPGIYSARFGEGELPLPISSLDRCQLLLNKLQGETNRAAQFICSLVVVLEEDRIYTVQESCKGEILHTITAKEGFGYDPIFTPLGYNGKSMSEIGEQEKNCISHRAKASLKLLSLFKD